MVVGVESGGGTEGKKKVCFFDEVQVMPFLLLLLPFDRAEAKEEKEEAPTDFFRYRKIEPGRGKKAKGICYYW